MVRNIENNEYKCSTFKKIKETTYSEVISSLVFFLFKLPSFPNTDKEKVWLPKNAEMFHKLMIVKVVVQECSKRGVGWKKKLTKTMTVKSW